MIIKQRLALALALGLQTAPAAFAAPPAMLVADEISVTNNGALLEARGAVEVFHQGSRLQAERLIYDRTKDQIRFHGPLSLTDANGAVITAQAAELSGDLQSGLLKGARLILEEQLQITAAELQKEATGRFVQARQTLASSCRICSTDEVPLWQIRASSVTHDTQEQQLYFENAQFRVAGVPVFYLPQMRLPGPQLERATGVLVPQITSDSTLGTGLRLPYFFAIAQDKDITLTPYATTGGMRALEMRYRQAFQTGGLEIEGALATDETVQGQTRSYIFAQGAHEAQSGRNISYSLQLASDDTFMRLYGYSDKDRLQSHLASTFVDASRYSNRELVGFQSLRSADQNSTLPSIMIQATEERRFSPDLIGGHLDLYAELHSHYRANSDPSISAAYTSVTARDVVRASVGAEWHREWIWQNGLITGLRAGLDADFYHTDQGTNVPTGMSKRITPSFGIEARLPLYKTAQNGALHSLEPIAQVIITPSNRDTVPSEDASTVEFDEANLFGLSRFTGRDNQELGARLNIGLRYNVERTDGLSYGGTIGRVFRAEDLGQFSAGSGLDGKSSDWLLSGYYVQPSRHFRIETRSLFDDSLSFSKAETLISWKKEGYDIATGYTWLAADAVSGRPQDTSEWAMDATIALNSEWDTRFDWRYDFNTNDASEAALGFSYYGDCLTVDFDIERRFTSSTTLTPNTSFGVTVSLAGFGTGQSARGRKEASCRF